MTRVISVRGTSVRVRSGDVTFHVIVHEDAEGKCTIELPQGIYMYEDGFRELRERVLTAYERYIIRQHREDKKKDGIQER